MSKNIRAYFDEKSDSIKIESDAKAGDQIQLRELTSFDKFIDKEVNTKYRVKIINEFKDSDEYKRYLLEIEEKNKIINFLNLREQELQNQIKSFNDKQKIIKNEAIEEFKNSFFYKELISNNEKNVQENIKLKEQLNSNKKIIYNEAIEEFKKSDEFISKLKEIEEIKNNNLKLNESILELNHKLEKFDLQKKNELSSKESEFNLKIQDKDNEIKNLKIEIENINKRKREMNIKQLGEDFEQECLKMYNESLGQTIDDSIFKKAELIEGNKADFVFEVYANNISINNDNENPLLGKVILEMKTEQQDSEYKRTNKSYLAKLEKDRNNSKSDIALLITELEREDYFYIKRDPEYKNIIIARPEAMVSLLTIIRIIFLKNKDIVLQELEFKDKQAILDEFNNFKESVLSKTIENINSNVLKIIEKAEKISKQANEILEITNIILNTHISTFRNKFENFNIENKVVKKIK